MQKQEHEEEYRNITDPVYNQFLNEIVGIDDDERIERKKRYALLKKLGIVVTLVYHCKRCNYLWLPKDFDAFFDEIGLADEYLKKMVPPKACARCKSKYWNQSPRRNTSHTKEDSKFHKFRRLSGYDKLEVFGHDMLTTKRILARHRVLEKRRVELEKAEEYDRDLMKKAGIDLDHSNEQ